MKVSYRWLQYYIDAPLPTPEKISEVLTMHALEVESMEKRGDDTIFDIAVLPNRSHDCLSHIGIAREVALLLNLEAKLPRWEYEGDTSVSTADAVTLTVPKGVPVRRAMKRLVVEVEVKESPAWVQELLLSVGQRPINNIVDATNLVMFETGQPVHAFNFDKIAVNTTRNSQLESRDIYIRNAREGETIETLDAKTYTLDESMLVIADSKKALDIAGIKGGAASGIDENTTRVLLSACTFHPTNIRKISRKLGLVTDASKRFEQDISPILAERAMNRLAETVAEVSGGKVAADTVEFYPKKRNPYVIGVSTEEVNKLLGTGMSDDDVETILTRLGFEWKKVKPIDEVLRLAPTFVGVPYKYGASISYDAPKKFDCSSLVAFLFAHAGVALPRVTADQYLFGEEVSASDLRPGDTVFAQNDAMGEEKEYEDIATGKTITQKVHHTKTVDFMKGTEIPGGVDHTGIYLGDGKIVHASGERREGSVVIESLSDSPSFKNIRGYRRVSDNEERYVVTVPPERLDLHAGPGFMISGNTADLIEEIGRVYGYENIKPEAPTKVPVPKLNKNFYYTNKIRDILIAEGFSEVMTYAFRGGGEVEVENPLAADKKYLRSTLEGGLREALENNYLNRPLIGIFLGGTPVRIFEIGTVFEKGKEYLQLGIAVNDVETMWQAINAVTGEFSSISPVTSKDSQITLINLSTIDVTAGELSDLAKIDASKTRFTPISSYPFVLRDIAVWVSKGVESPKVEKLIKDEAGELLVRSDLFDTFNKDGKTSYAYSLVFQSQEKTLSDDEVNAVMGRITETLNGTEGWRVR